MVRSFLRSLLTGPTATQMRRFVTVGFVAASVQMAVLWSLVDIAGVNYLVGALLAIELTIALAYVLNNAWTFQGSANTGTVDFMAGLLKTNVVRGTAIPIQLAVLFVLVEWREVSYLISNAIAIVISGLYRYLLDAKWTWG